MLRLLCIALSLFLSLQLAVADPVLRVSRHSKTSSLVTKSLLSALLVRRGKYIARASSGCPSGYQQCTNYPDSCAPTGSYCCNDLYVCPNDTTCFGSECCPNTAQTCNGNSCCDAGSECCTDESCCEPGLFCCNDSIGGCCPNGSTCIANTDECSNGGSGGGGSGGGGTTVATATPSKSTAPLVNTSSSTNVITFNGPTTTTTTSTASSSTHSSTVSSGGSTSTASGTGLTTGGAAPRVAPGKQLVALAAVVGLPILHNVLHAL